MGLLDSLGGDTNGLLAFLRNNAMNQQMPSGGAPGDQAQYGQQMPMQANAQMIPQNPPPVIQAGSMPPVQPMPQAATQAPQQALGTPPPADSPLGSNLMAGYQNLHHGGGLIGSLVAAVTGQRNDPQGVALQQQQQVANLTAKALLAKGADLPTVQAAVAPGNGELLKALIGQYYGKDKYKVVQTGEDALGRKTFQQQNESEGTFKPIPAPEGSDASSGGLGDMSKTGPEYLATVPKAQAGVLQGMVDGTIQPPSSFALSKPYWQAMLGAAKNLDPNFDANTWATRHKLSTDMAASGNSSMGGILANGKSAFAHLSDLSGSMSDLGNASHDYPGGGGVAAVQNYLGNKTFAGSDTLAKIKAINDNLGHYGQESTKFYSGTGGGVEERMNALKEMNPTTTSSEEMASYLAKEKSLMTDRLKQKEAQIRDTMGQGYLDKHPIFTPDLQQTLDTIDGNIAKLKGSSPAAPAAAPVTGEGAIAHNPQTGETIIRKNGKWVPLT